MLQLRRRDTCKPLAVEDSISDLGDSDEIVKECRDQSLVQHEAEAVYIVSPTFKDRVKVKLPNARFGSSKSALKELIHIEEQVKDLCGFPDFGYGTDNYIFESKAHSESPWMPLTNLIKNPKRFEWLLNFIKLGELKKKVQQEKEHELIVQAQKEQEKAERVARVKFML